MAGAKWCYDSGMEEHASVNFGKDMCRVYGHLPEWKKRNRRFHGIEVYCECQRCFERLG